MTIAHLLHCALTLQDNVGNMILPSSTNFSVTASSTVLDPSSKSIVHSSGPLVVFDNLKLSFPPAGVSTIKFSSNLIPISASVDIGPGMELL